MNIIACVPVNIPPDIKARHPLPSNYPPPDYTQVPCPICKEPMCLGPKSAEMISKGDGKAVCMTCLRNFGVQPTSVKTLT